MLTRRLYALFHPELYHGWGKQKSFFEGWYFKIVSADNKYAYAIIPGIAKDKNLSHCFIQVLNGIDRKAEYHKFDEKVFQVKPYQFDVKIENNHFSKNRIILELPDFKADLKLNNLTPWPSQWYSPGIMGPFSFVPFMQCYHGILSMNHTISGTVIDQDKTIDFSQGRGYMEKDWGSSFPTGYIWMQSNHFSKTGISIKSSVARIPWLFSSFTGYIAGVLVNDRIIEFTTYNLTKLRKCEVSKEEVLLVYENPKHLLEIKANRSEATELASPILGLMDGRIEESMTASIEVLLKDKRSGIVLLHDTGHNAGLEVAGDITTLVK